MTVHLAENKQTKIDAHRICKLMRETKNALNECICNENRSRASKEPTTIPTTNTGGK